MSSNQFQPDNTMPGLDLKLFFFIFLPFCSGMEKFHFYYRKNFSILQYLNVFVCAIFYIWKCRHTFTMIEKQNQ